jgi:hypothetical protein
MRNAMRRIMLAAVLGLAIGPTGVAEAGLFTGQPIEIDTLWPNITTVESSVRTTVSGTGPEFSDSVTAISLSESQIDLTFHATAFLSGYQFEGYSIYNYSGSIPSFTGVTIDAATNLSGFDSSRVSFDANHVYVNLEGLFVNSSNDVTLDVTAESTAVPEPATLAPAVFAALAGVGLAWRKRRRTAA